MVREGESVKHYQTGTGLRSERYEAQTRETGTQRQEWILLGHLGKNNVSLMNHNPAINHLLIALSRRQENIACITSKTMRPKRYLGGRKGIFLSKKTHLSMKDTKNSTTVSLH